MVGLGIAAVIAILSLALGTAPGAIFKRSTKFLYCWYLAVAIILTLVLGFVAVTGSAATGLLFGGILGGILGATIGSTAAVLITLVIAIGYVFQIFGARTLHQSLTLNLDETFTVDRKQLVTGVLLLIVGLFIMPLLS